MFEDQFIEISQIDGLMTFLSSIDWWDPWLIGLIVFHISIFFMAIFTTSYGNTQALLFFILLLMVYFSEGINKLAADNWKLFSKQQYFDSNGIFISVVFSMPILLNCMLMVGRWLYQSTQLMKMVKRAQIQEQRREIRLTAHSNRDIKTE